MHLEPADTGLQPQDGSSAQDGDDGPSPPSPHFHHLMCFWTKLLINENFFTQRPPTLGPGHKVPSLTYRRIRLAKCSHMNDFRPAFSSSAVHHSCLHFSVLSGGEKRLCNTPFPFISCNSGCFFFVFVSFILGDLAERLSPLQPEPSECNGKAHNCNKCCPQLPAEEPRNRLLSMRPRGKGQDVTCNKTVTVFNFLSRAANSENTNKNCSCSLCPPFSAFNTGFKITVENCLQR